MELLIHANCNIRLKHGWLDWICLTTTHILQDILVRHGWVRYIPHKTIEWNYLSMTNFIGRLGHGWGIASNISLWNVITYPCLTVPGRRCVSGDPLYSENKVMDVSLPLLINPSWNREIPTINWYFLVYFLWGPLLLTWFNSSPPGQNGPHFRDDILKGISMNEKICILIRISLKFVPKGPINNIPALVQMMAWRRSGDKPLSEPMLTQFTGDESWTDRDLTKMAIIYSLFTEDDFKSNFLSDIVVHWFEFH